MRINTKFSAAIHCLVLLELFQDGGDPLTSELIAKSVGTNPVVVRRILSKLKQAGLIRAQAGCPGYQLAKDAGTVTLLDIYRAVQDEEEKALFDLHPRPFPGCPCGRHIHESLGTPLGQAQQAMEDSLEKYTLRDAACDVAARIEEENKNDRQENDENGTRKETRN